MTKSKKIIVGGLIAMLGIVGATTATSGVAWFTTTRTAQVTLTNLVATAAEGNLQIAGGTVITESGLTATIDPQANTIAVAATATLTDVSSVNGVNFYKVSTVNNVSTSKAEITAVNSINSTLYNYYAWDVQVTNTSTTAPMDVYLSHNGLIFSDVNTTDAYAPQNWYRLAIFDSTWAAGSLVYSYNQASETGHDKGINAAGVVNNETPRTGDYDHASTASEVNEDPGTASSTTTNQLLIKNLANATPKTLIFVIWCEGLLTPTDGVGLQVTGAFNLVGFNHAAA